MFANSSLGLLNCLVNLKVSIPASPVNKVPNVPKPLFNLVNKSNNCVAPSINDFTNSPLIIEFDNSSYVEFSILTFPANDSNTLACSLLAEPAELLAVSTVFSASAKLFIMESNKLA